MHGIDLILSISFKFDLIILNQNVITPPFRKIGTCTVWTLAFV